MFLNSLEINNWEWLINLSGACAPLMPQRKIKEILINESKGDGFINHCFGFTVNKESIWYPAQPNDEQQSVILIGKARALVGSDLLSKIQKKEFNLVNNLMHRRAVYCSENFSNSTKMLMIRGLYTHETNFRKEFWRTFEYIAGRQWFVLHRSAVEWLCSSLIARDVYYTLSHQVIADESYVQSCLWAAPSKIKNRTNFKNNFRARNGAPGIFSIDHLDRHLSDKFMYARKIDDHDEAFRLHISKLIRDAI